MDQEARTSQEEIQHIEKGKTIFLTLQEYLKTLSTLDDSAGEMRVLMKKRQDLKTKLEKFTKSYIL